MKAEIVSIGTELLLGTIVDTNAAYLAGRLAALGIDCFHVSAVGDNLDRIQRTLELACGRSDLVITTGGLGPTQDDLTREAIASLMSEEMRVVPELEQHVRDFFSRRKAPMPSANVKQATLIDSARVINNPIGSAPGWWVSRTDKTGTQTIIAMPGVPFEMKRMWEHEVEPHLRGASGSYIVSRTLKVLGHGESAVAARVADLLEGANPTLAPYAKQDGIHLRMTAKSDSAEAARKMIAPLEARLRERLGNAVYGVDEDTPQGIVSELLASRDARLALLEIGTGVAGALTPLFLELGTRGRSDLATVALVAGNTGEAAKILGGPAPGSAELENVAVSLLEHASADIVLGVHATISEGIEQGSVNSSLQLFVRERTSNSGASSEQHWKTAPDQVRRLAGLAACNMLRLHLLEQ